MYGNGYKNTDQKRYTSRRRRGGFWIGNWWNTQIKVGEDYFWIWIALESDNKLILGLHISFQRNMFVVEQFLQPLGKKYGNIKVSTDTGAWYPNAGKFSKLGHHLHSMYEKSIVERTIQYMFYCRFWNKPLYHYITTFNKYC